MRVRASRRSTRVPFEEGSLRESARDERLPSLVPEPLFRVDLIGHCAEGGGSEVLMQVTRTLAARIRKWLEGLLGRRPAKAPYGAGARCAV
jgi:hypothetical protein